MKTAAKAAAMNNRCTVIGGGLAGTEAAMQLAKRGVRVTLCEMKPYRFSPAHRSDKLSELVCSNSLKAMRLSSASGLLRRKWSCSVRRLEAAKNAPFRGGRLPSAGRFGLSHILLSRSLIKVVRAR